LSLTTSSLQQAINVSCPAGSAYKPWSVCECLSVTYWWIQWIRFRWWQQQTNGRTQSLKTMDNSLRMDWNDW